MYTFFFKILSNQSLLLQLSSVLSCVQFFATPWTAVCRLPCPSPNPGACSNSCPLSQWCHPTISSSFIPFYSCLQSSQHQGLFQWISSSHQVSKVLEFQFQHQWGMQTSKFIEKVEWWVWGLGEKGMRHQYLTRTEFLFGKDDVKVLDVNGDEIVHHQCT